MRTALEKLESAIQAENEGREHMLFILFKYGGFEFEYQGRYYAYVRPIGDCRGCVEDEYGWSGFDEMLDATITKTGKAVREMLAEIPEHALEITFDSPTLPPNAAVVDEV